jgi:L-fucose mutarotase
MLRGISPLISPDLLKVLMEMGHGDELVLADANFPAASHAQRLVRLDGVRIAPLLAAVLRLFPLDRYDPFPVTLMDPVPGDPNPAPIWDDYFGVLEAFGVTGSRIARLSRHDFYARARTAFAIVATGEPEAYGNIVLRKGVVEAPVAQDLDAAGSDHRVAETTG